MLSDLIHIRDRVLDGARPVEDHRVLDVGCGDGLIAFGALERGAGMVVFTDISPPLLQECQRRAAAEGFLERCRFVEAPAEHLRAIESASMDIVTTRSVLIYVRDKKACFSEFARVLRPRGRLSIFEPINRFGQREWTGTRFFGADLEPVAELAEKVRRVYRRFDSAEDPMLDFDERDLIQHAEDAGFEAIGLTLNAEVRAADPCRWDVFVNGAGNPNIPTPAEAMAEALTADERDEFTAYMRPIVESGQRTHRMAHAYLRAVRP